MTIAAITKSFPEFNVDDRKDSQIHFKVNGKMTSRQSASNDKREAQSFTVGKWSDGSMCVEIWSA